MKKTSVTGQVFAMLLLAGCGVRKIGVLSPHQLALEGRPQEALQALPPEEATDRARDLNEATLLHQAGRWAESEAAFARVSKEGLHETEQLAMARLHALNQLALTQQAGVLPAAWGLAVASAPDAARVVVIFEQGWAPEVTAEEQPTAIKRLEDSTRSAYRARPQAPWVAESLRVDELSPVSAIELENLSQAWGLQSVSRASQSEPSGLSWAERLERAQRLSHGWWTSPTRFSAASLVVAPGSHVVMVSTRSGPLEQRVDLKPGQTFFKVVRQ